MGLLDQKDGKLGQDNRNILESRPDSMHAVTSARCLFSGKIHHVSLDHRQVIPKAQPLHP